MKICQFMSDDSIFDSFKLRGGPEISSFTLIIRGGRGLKNDKEI